MSKDNPLVNVEILASTDMVLRNNAVREFRAGETLLEPEEIVARLEASGCGQRIGAPRGNRLGQPFMLGDGGPEMFIPAKAATE